MATGFSKTTFNNLGTAPAIDATFLNTLQDFLVAIANGGSGSVVKADLADVATDANHATDADNADAVSAAGIGVTSIPAMASNADNYKTGGIFYCSSAITNAPFYGVKNANILVAPKDSNNVTQFAMSVDGSKAIKMRQCTSGTWTSWSDVGGGGSGAVNFLQNKLSENDLSSITNTGCTVTWDTSEDLSVAGSLKIEAAASGTGRKVEIDLSELSDAQITELCRLSFFYKMTTGGDDSVEVYLLNGSDKFYFDIPFLAANSGTLTKYDAAGMVTNRTGNKLVFGFKDNSASTVYLGDALLTPRVLPQGAVISEWAYETPSLKATTTDPTLGTCDVHFFRWRRVGGDVEIEWKLHKATNTGFANGSGTYYIPIPTHLAIDLEHCFGASDVFYVCGEFSIRDTSGGTSYLGQSRIPRASPTQIQCFFQDASTTSPWSSSSGALTTTVDREFSVKARFPVSGWTSSINLVTEAHEFASNSSSTDADDTTSFVYGPQGAAGIIATTTLTARRVKRVRFKNKIQPTDSFAIEFYLPSTGGWVNGNIFIGGYGIANNYCYITGEGGMQYSPVSGSDTDLDIIFQRYPLGSTSYGWGYSGFAGIKWRVRKISNGNMAEAPASGIYESGQNANGYYVKYVDGTMVQWGVETITAYPHTKTLPVAFADANWAFASTRGYNSTAAFVMLGSTKTNQACNLYCATHAGGTLSSGVVEWHAIGKWNLSRSVAAPGTPVGESAVFVECKKTTSYGPPSLQPFDFSEVVEDALGCVTTGANWKFTAPVSGLYLVQVTATLGATTTAYIYKNGVQGQPFGALGSTTAFNHFPFSAIIRLSQGDYIDIRMTYTTATTADRRIQITRLSA